MAPELALSECKRFRSPSVVLDPMAGSGTSLRSAAESGHRAIGFDVDPLSVSLARVWTTPVDVQALRSTAADIIVAATVRGSPGSDEEVPPDAQAFMDYWFGPDQQHDLAALSREIRRADPAVRDALAVALSRIIITKERGASLARDVSHSRPHRAMDANEYDVLRGYAAAVEQLANRLEKHPPPGNVEVHRGDARSLPLADESVDAVVTSPPYLNAIDYLRGHRLALVWLGFGLDELREVRGASIGAEKRIDADADVARATELVHDAGQLTELPARQYGMVLRYADDMYWVLGEVGRVLRRGGRATFVVGNSAIRGVFVKNDAVVTRAAAKHGLRVVRRSERPLPASKRYLPPPGHLSGAELEKRMRSETVLTFSARRRSR